MEHWVKEKLNTIENKLDNISQDIIIIKIDQASQKEISKAQAEDIERHISRTDKLQKLVEPLHNSAQQIRGGIKVFLALAFILGIVQTILAILR